MQRLRIIALLVALSGVGLTAISVLFGPGIIDRITGRSLVFNVTPTELALPPGTKIVASDPTETIPNWVASFTIANTTSVNCVHPLFRLTLPGPISRALITDTNEKKEILE